MSIRTRFAFLISLALGLSACGGSGAPDSGEGDIDIQLIDPPIVEVPEDSNILNTALPLVENFGSYTNFDQADTINFFSPDYKSLASVAVSGYTDSRPSLYYPSCCFFDADDPAGAITVNHTERLGIVSDDGDPSLLISDARFTVGQTLSELANSGETDPKRNATPGSDPGVGWGELDLSADYRISFCVALASGPGDFQIYVNNSTTSESNSIHGGGAQGSRIFNVPNSFLVPGERVTINIPGDTTLQSGGAVVDTKPAVVGTENSFLQFRVSSGSTAIIDDLLIESQAEDGAAALGACSIFVPATVPAALDAAALFASDSQIAVSWSASLGATSYDLSYGTADDADAGTLVTGITDTSYTLTELTNGTEYFVFVRAVNNVGVSDWSPSASSTPVAPVGGNCAATVSVDPSAINAITWNVYDGCTSPDQLGSVVINGGTATNFAMDAEEAVFYSVSDAGVLTLDTTALGDDRSTGDLTDIIAGDATSYPKNFTLITRYDGSFANANTHRGFEFELSFGDENARRVKTIFRPDSSTNGRIKFEDFQTSGVDLDINDVDMSDGFHTYHFVFTMVDPATTPDNVTIRVYRDGVSLGNFSGNADDGGSGSSRLRIGENSGSTYHSSLDWFVWSDAASAAALEPVDLIGELPDGIGDLGSYAAADTSLVFEELFNGPTLTDGDASTSNFFSTAYLSQSGNASVPMFNVTSSGSRIVIGDVATDGNLSLNDARFSIGDALPDTDTADTDTSTRGDLDLSQAYTITFDVLANANIDNGTDTGKCQIYVDNNTSSSSRSIHGGSSKIFEKLVTEISDMDTATGQVTVSSDLGTASSFIQFRCDSRTTEPVTIDNLRIQYQ